MPIAHLPAVRSFRSVSSPARRSLRCMLVSLLFGAVAATTASASPILYTLTGNFSGSLNGNAFTNQNATFSLLSDTAFVQSQGGFFINTTGTSTFQLAGGSTATFLSPTFGVESEYGAASFNDAPQSFAAGEYNESTPYDILSELGVSFTGNFVSYGTTPASTSNGDLILTGASSDTTFTTSDPSSITPEPGSLLLSGTGLLALAGTLRRRDRRPQPAV